MSTYSTTSTTSTTGVTSVTTWDLPSCKSPKPTPWAFNNTWATYTWDWVMDMAQEPMEEWVDTWEVCQGLDWYGGWGNPPQWQPATMEARDNFWGYLDRTGTDPNNWAGAWMAWAHYQDCRWGDPTFCLGTKTAPIQQDLEVWDSKAWGSPNQLVWLFT